VSQCTCCSLLRVQAVVDDLAGSVMRVLFNNEPTCSAYEYGLLVFQIETAYLTRLINGALLKSTVTNRLVNFTVSPYILIH
jgi:hypothetical protein